MAAIAASLGRSKASIYSRATYLGLAVATRAPRPTSPPPAPSLAKPGALLARTGAFTGNAWTSRDHVGPPRRYRPDAEIAAENLRYQEERRRFEQAERGRLVGIEEAKLELQRRGRAVYRASVVGGRADRWVVSGLGKDVTDEQLVGHARRVLA